MDERLFIYLLIGLISVGAGLLAGNLSVYGFNHLPDDWFRNERAHVRGEDMPPGVQRIKSVPWKGVVSALFSVLFIYMGVMDWQYALSAGIYLIIIFFMTAGLAKYGDLLEVFNGFLFIGSLGFVLFRHGWVNMALGALVGLAAGLAIFLIMTKGFSRDDFPAAGVITFAVAGLGVGAAGMVPVIIMTVFTSVIGMMFTVRVGRPEAAVLRAKRASNMLLHFLIWASVFIIGGGALQSQIFILIGQYFL